MGASQSPSVQGALQNASIEVALLWWLCKITRGFECTYKHFSLFPTDIGGASLWRLHKALLWKGLYYGGFAKPLGTSQSHFREWLYYGGFAKPLYKWEYTKPL